MSPEKVYQETIITIVGGWATHLKKNMCKSNFWSVPQFLGLKLPKHPWNHHLWTRFFNLKKSPSDCSKSPEPTSNTVLPLNKAWHRGMKLWRPKAWRNKNPWQISGKFFQWGCRPWCFCLFWQLLDTMGIPYVGWVPMEVIGSRSLVSRFISPIWGT